MMDGKIPFSDGTVDSDIISLLGKFSIAWKNKYRVCACYHLCETPGVVGPHVGGN